MSELFFLVEDILRPIYNSKKFASVVEFILKNYWFEPVKEEELRDAILRFYSIHTMHNIKRLLLDFNIINYYFDEEGRKYKITEHFREKLNERRNV